MSLAFEGDGTISGFDPVSSGFGRTLQVVQTVKTDTFSTSSTSYTDVTGLSVTITPTTATSKILLVAHVNVSSAGNGGIGLVFSGGNSSNYIGATAGTRPVGANWVREDADFRLNDTNLPTVIVYLDSPATTSATTYSVQMRTTSPTVYVNQSSIDTDASTWGRAASSLTAIEVAA